MDEPKQKGGEKIGALVWGHKERGEKNVCPTYLERGKNRKDKRCCGKKGGGEMCPGTGRMSKRGIGKSLQV